MHAAARGPAPSRRISLPSQVSMVSSTSSGRPQKPFRKPIGKTMAATRPRSGSPPARTRWPSRSRRVAPRPPDTISVPRRRDRPRSWRPARPGDADPQLRCGHRQETNLDRVGPAGGAACAGFSTGWNSRPSDHSTLTVCAGGRPGADHAHQSWPRPGHLQSTAESRSRWRVKRIRETLRLFPARRAPRTKRRPGRSRSRSPRPKRSPDPRPARP